MIKSGILLFCSKENKTIDKVAHQKVRKNVNFKITTDLYKELRNFSNNIQNIILKDLERKSSRVP